MEILETNQERDMFLLTMTSILSHAKWFGVSVKSCSVFFFWAIIVLILLTAIEVGAIWKVIKVWMGLDGRSDTLEGSLTIRLAGSIFYGNAFISLLLLWKLASSWKMLSIYWAIAEVNSGLKLPSDSKLRKRIVTVTNFIAIFGVAEHFLSITGNINFELQTSGYLQQYILKSHAFLIKPNDYNIWLALSIFIVSNLATVLWNFQDLVIILISMGLSSRYYRINSYLYDTVKTERRLRNVEKGSTTIYKQQQTWRRLREAYVRQAALVRMIDRELGALVLLSQINNFYFICLQLYNGLHRSTTSLSSHIYYMSSLGWLLFRAISVVLAAADVNISSKRALPYLYMCPRSAYNVEIKRLEQQLTHDFVALTGMGFFSLNRKMLLEVAGNILKYELVLIQYDF